MNEYEILTAMLTRSTEQTRGATERELEKALKLSSRASKVKLASLLAQYAEYVAVLGLELRYNPLDRHWFLSQRADLANLLELDPFSGKTRLGATLLALVTLAFAQGNPVDLESLRQVRKKAALTRDLDELEGMGFVRMDSGRKRVTLTPKVGYFCDLRELLEDLEHVALSSDDPKDEDPS